MEYHYTDQLQYDSFPQEVFTNPQTPDSDIKVENLTVNDLHSFDQTTTLSPLLFEKTELNSMYTTTPGETIEQIYEKFRSFSTKELEDHLDKARKHNNEVKYPSFKEIFWEGDLSLALSARIDGIDTTPYKTIEQLREEFASFSSSKSHNQDDDTGNQHLSFSRTSDNAKTPEYTSFLPNNEEYFCNQHLSFSQTYEDVTVSGDLGSFVMVYNS